jgi:signal peptidase I
MGKVVIEQGQISLFDLPIQKPVIEISKVKSKIEPIGNFEKIINLYKDTCSRMVKNCGGELIVELDDKSLYFNSAGEKEFELAKDLGLLPGDEIIIANQDKHLNNLQLKKLKSMNVEKYIKRKGDINIIIPGVKTTVINPKGWVLEYTMEPRYQENEVFFVEKEKPKELAKGDPVTFMYGDIKCKGKVFSIYNNGDTVNVEWDNKVTAMYIGGVTPINC